MIEMVSVKSLLNLSEAFKGLKAAFDESEHPRVGEGNTGGGQFTAGGGGISDQPKKTGAARVRYHKGSIEDAVGAAKRLKADHNLYVYPTQSGIAIGDKAPPFGLQHILIKPDGTHQRVAVASAYDKEEVS